MSGSLVVLAVLLLTSGAAAQGSAPSSVGTQFGMQELDNSGQVGEATLFPSGKATIVTIRIDGSNGRRESAGISAQTCTSTGLGGRAYVLKPISPAGWSRSTVHGTLGQLRSGNYSVVVLASTKAGARPVACGHLY